LALDRCILFGGWVGITGGSEASGTGGLAVLVFGEEWGAAWLAKQPAFKGLMRVLGLPGTSGGVLGVEQG